MDNESRATPLACRVTDFNVLPLGALIFLAAVNPRHNAEFSIEALHRPDRFDLRILHTLAEGLRGQVWFCGL